MKRIWNDFLAWFFADTQMDPNDGFDDTPLWNY